MNRDKLKDNFCPICNGELEWAGMIAALLCKKCQIIKTQILSAVNLGLCVYRFHMFITPFNTKLPLNKLISPYLFNDGEWKISFDNVFLTDIYDYQPNFIIVPDNLNPFEYWMGLIILA